MMPSRFIFQIHISFYLLFIHAVNLDFNNCNRPGTVSDISNIVKEEDNTLVKQIDTETLRIKYGECSATYRHEGAWKQMKISFIPEWVD